MRPSWIVRVRSQLSATPESWVTITMVACRRGVQIANERQDLLAGLGIQVAGRLVGQQDGRVGGQGACNRDALALAARELIRQVVEAVGETDEGEQLARAFGDALAAASRGGAGEGPRSRRR